MRWTWLSRVIEDTSIRWKGLKQEESGLRKCKENLTLCQKISDFLAWTADHTASKARPVLPRSQGLN